MMNLPRKTLDAAKAVATLRERRGRLEHCMAAMAMTTTTPALLLKRIKRLLR